MKPGAWRADERFDGFIGAIAVLSVILLLTLSPMALGAIGWNYDAPGGAGPTRFHPSSYLALLMFLMVAIRDGNPLTSLLLVFGRDPRLLLFMACWSMLFIHAVRNQELPAAAPIDTFLVPFLMLVVLRRLGERTHRRLEIILHCGMAANALLGLGEFLTGLRLTPYIAGGVAITDDWRSTALLGHPLGNALMTGAYIMALMLGGGARLTGFWRIAMIGLQFAGMVAFGGRASLVLLLAFCGVMAAREGLAFLAGKRIPLIQLAMIGLAVPLLVGVLGGLFSLGFFDKFLLRFVEDKGSAEARVVMFELFNGFTWTELLLGPSQTQLGYFVHIYRLEFGIESVWVAFSLYYGIIPGVIFLAGFLCFLHSLVSDCRKSAWIILGYFMLVNSTFLGIAGKSINFTNLCLMLLLLLPAIRRSAPMARQNAAPFGGATIRPDYRGSAPRLTSGAP
jgi:hypothetical protein